MQPRPFEEWIEKGHQRDANLCGACVLLIRLGFHRLESPKKSTSLLLRWGWVFLERTWILSGIQFTTHFIEFFVVETKRFVGSCVHV